MSARRLLTIGHSYCVGANRRLAHELAATGEWDVTVAGPARFRGDFRVHEMTPLAGERCRLRPVKVYWSGRVHTMLYGSQLRALLGESWDLVHCWAEPYVASAVQVAAWNRSRAPLVFSTFQNIDKRYPPPFNWFERYNRTRADGLIAFGQTVFDVARARRLPMRHCAIIPAGVDTDRFAPDGSARARVRAALGWHDPVPVIGFLGRFVPEKGVAFLTAVLDQLEGEWRALFVGSGPLEAELRDWARRYGDRVAIAAAVEHDAVPDWLNAMDLLCAPSQTTDRWREQFGRMLVEAFAVGIPVVASDSGEIPHVVGDAAAVVPERDAAAWAHVVQSLLADPEARAALAEKGRTRARTLFDWRVVARAQSQFFRRIVESDGVDSAHPVRLMQGAGA